MLTDTVATSTGIADSDPITDFDVYPNPAADRIIIGMRNPIPAAISVSDMTGRVLIERKPDSSPYTLETDILTPGLYIVTVGGISRRICIR
jgi:hypothetical protein